MKQINMLRMKIRHDQDAGSVSLSRKIILLILFELIFDIFHGPSKYIQESISPEQLRTNIMFAISDWCNLYKLRSATTLTPSQGRDAL